MLKRRIHNEENLGAENIWGPAESGLAKCILGLLYLGFNVICFYSGGNCQEMLGTVAN